MKVLLIKPFSSFSAFYFSPPLGLAYIASCLENDGHTVKIIDSDALNYNIPDIIKEIKGFQPEVVGVTATTMTLCNALKVVKSVKDINPNCLTVLGGPHVSAKPKETLEFYKDVDVIVRREGELTFTDLLNRYEKKDKGGFCDVRGISYRKDGRIIENNDRPFIEELDSIPFPAYHLLPMERYIYFHPLINTLHIRKKGILTSDIFTSRGCPYDCTFCGSRALWSKKWRKRGPQNVIEEITFLKNKYNIKIIDFVDDTFTIDKNRVFKICELIKKEKLDCSFRCNTRVDHLSKEVANSLNSVGFKSVCLGLESGVQKTLDYLCKGFTIEESINAVKIAKEAGLKVSSGFIIGVPGETKEDINKTISFARRLDLYTVSFSLLTPFPGTKIYEYAKTHDLLLNENWDDFKIGINNSIMRIPGFTEGELKWLYMKGYLLCNFTPLKFLKYLFKEFPSC